MPRNHRDNASLVFAVTSYSQDTTLAGDESTAANIAAVLATVIKTLQDKGVLDGTTVA